MKALLIVVILLVAGVVGLGFYRGWFSFTSESGGGSANATLTVDKDKFQEDSKAAMHSVEGLGSRSKDKAGAPGALNRDGTMVRVTGGELTMMDEQGKEHKHPLAADVKVTCDTKTCTVADLKAGMRIRVTTDEAAPHAASRIEALDKDAAFASSSHDGKVVSITGNKLVMTNMGDKGEKTCTLAADAKVTCDGKLCKASDLKPGMRIRVTTESGDAHAATHIEALDENPDFEKGSPSEKQSQEPKHRGSEG